MNKANPNGHVAMRWWSILSLAVQFPLKSNDLLWPYFLDLYLIQYFFHTHTSFNWSGFFSILHLIYISCFIMSPELRRGELNLQLIFNYFQNQWHPGSLHSDLLIIFLVWNKISPNNSLNERLTLRIIKNITQIEQVAAYKLLTKNLVTAWCTFSKEISYALLEVFLTKLGLPRGESRDLSMPFCIEIKG